ncbi:MAG TPA: hypothetical protein VMX75_14230 [Spirochaetia bacterium]|nr:hypothetical protein [Spirochaetia bacterium]
MRSENADVDREQENWRKPALGALDGGSLQFRSQRLCRVQNAYVQLLSRLERVVQREEYSPQHRINRTPLGRNL